MKKTTKVHKLYLTPKAGETEPEWYVKKPCPKKFMTPSKGEKGSVDASKVAALKAKPNRPKPLKRKKTKLTKKEKKELIMKRKEAKAKFAMRSKETMMDLEFKKNQLMREKKKEMSLHKTLARKHRQPEPMYPHILEIMYSVGPQPKYKTISNKFREYRKFAKAQMKAQKKVEKDLKKKKSSDVTYLYKVGKPMMKAK